MLHKKCLKPKTNGNHKIKHLFIHSTINTVECQLTDNWMCKASFLPLMTSLHSKISVVENSTMLTCMGTNTQSHQKSVHLLVTGYVGVLCSRHTLSITKGSFGTLWGLRALVSFLWQIVATCALIEWFPLLIIANTTFPSSKLPTPPHPCYGDMFNVNCECSVVRYFTCWLNLVPE